MILLSGLSIYYLYFENAKRTCASYTSFKVDQSKVCKNLFFDSVVCFVFGVDIN